MQQGLSIINKFRYNPTALETVTAKQKSIWQLLQFYASSWIEAEHIT